jgi:UDP-N-acetylglucosamine 2-epimerase (non-hydrolysing)
MLELQKRNIPYYFIHTGQHNLGDFCELFNVKRPDVVLTEEPKKSSKFHAKVGKAIFWNLGLLLKIKKELKKIPGLKYVIYHGDTMTTATAAMASSKIMNPGKKYKNVHLEAGLRSENLREPFPEEIARKIADSFSDILLTVSERGCKNMEKHKGKKDICLVGNTIMDSVDSALKIAKKRKIKPLSKRRFGLITVHRHENIKKKKRLEKILKIFEALTIPCYFALHDNTKKQFVKHGLWKKLNKLKNIKIIKPLDYISFIYQMSKCSIIVCDGGSMQEESLIFKKPCIILRKATERQEGLKTNFQFLSELKVRETKNKIREYLDKSFKPKKFKNPYGKKGVSKKIVRILK